MSGNDDTLHPDDEFDVEGHGFKEVAVGLTAAGVMASGAYAAVNMANVAPGTTGGAGALVAGVQDDVADRTPWLQQTTTAPTEVGGELAVGIARPETSRRIGGVNRLADPERAQDPIGQAGYASAHAMRDAQYVVDATARGVTRYTGDTEATVASAVSIDGPRASADAKKGSAQVSAADTTVTVKRS